MSAFLADNEGRLVTFSLQITVTCLSDRKSAHPWGSQLASARAPGVPCLCLAAPALLSSSV